MGWLTAEELWWDAKGNWDKAHECAQADDGLAGGDRVHAYLHRKEGDLDNAGYWYGRAGKKLVGLETDDEWKEIANALLLEGGW